MIMPTIAFFQRPTAYFTYFLKFISNGIEFDPTRKKKEREEDEEEERPREEKMKKQ